MIEQVQAKFLRYLIDCDGKVPDTYCKKVFASEINEDYLSDYVVKEGKWYNTAYSLIFDLIRHYWERFNAMPTDDLIAGEIIARSDLTKLVKDDVSDRLNEIRQFDGNPNEFEFIITQVRENYVRNKALSVMTKAVDRLQGDPTKALDFLQSQIHDVRSRTAVTEDADTQAMPHWKFMELAGEDYESDDGLVSIKCPFGFHSWDMVYGGIGEGEVCVISASSNVGKSFALHEIAFNAAFKLGKKVVIVEREMQRKQLTLRLLARQTRIPSRKIRNKHLLSETEDALIREYIEEGKNRDNNNNLLWLPFERAENVEMIRREIEAYFGDEKPDLIMIDYLDELEPVRKHNSDWEAKQEIMAGLKKLATHFRCAVLTATQNNAGGIDNPDAGVKEVANKSIVKKAHFIIMLTEDPQERYEPPKSGEYEGRPGIINATFVKARGESKNLRFRLRVEFATSLVEDDGDTFFLPSSGLQEKPKKQKLFGNHKD
jgi:replicative DNA helicase